MKKRVDIGKLIDEKFSDGELTFRQFNEIIDSVLQEKLDNYLGKVDTAELEEVSQGEDVFDYAFGTGGAENPIAKEPGYGGREPSNVVPDKLAEAVQGTGPTTITVTVPDFFSMITNQEMKTGDDDRNMINKIIEKMGTANNWEQRIQLFNQFVENYIVSIDDNNFSEVTSKLIYLNVLKKISLFTAQPGKLFEYVISPIIGPNIQVLGATDTSIIDVSKDGKFASSNDEYSIKFFTSGESDLQVEGSYEELEKYIANSGNRPPIVRYIIARVTEEDSKVGAQVQFLKFELSPDIKYFTNNGYREINELQGGVLFTHDIRGIGLYVKSKKEVADKTTIYQDLEKEKEPESPRNTPPNTTYEIPGLGTKTERQWNAEVNKLSFQISSKKGELQKAAKSNNTQQITTLKGEIQSLEQEQETIKKARIAAKKKYNSQLKTPQTPPATNENKSLINESSEAQFSFPFKGAFSMPSIKSSLISINLGNPKSYNEQQIKISGDIARAVVNTLNEFSSLGENMTTFLTDESDPMAGQKAINNSRNIVTNINKIGTHKKQSFK